MTADGMGAVCFSVWGGTAVVVVTGSGSAVRAGELLREELAGFDRACSRFRADSEIRELACQAGTPVRVSPLLADALNAAMRAAELTDGLVDPTVGRALVELGYDHDFAELPVEGLATSPSPAPGWWRLGWDFANRTVVLPHGIELDLGATAKALAAAVTAAVALISVPITTDAGEWLEHHLPRTPLLRIHTELGDYMLPWAIALFVATAVVAAREAMRTRQPAGTSTSVSVSDGPGAAHIERIADRDGIGGRPMTLALAALALIVAAGSTATIYKIGDSGARAAWDGKYSQTAIPSSGKRPAQDD